MGHQACLPQAEGGCKAISWKAVSNSKSHKETLKKELQRLCELRVLKWQPESDWASPSFIVPKQNQTVRFVSDFRKVNKRIVRNLFPIPKISTVLPDLEGFTYATALDLNMGYYTIRLDPDLSRTWCRFWEDRNQTNSNSR